MDCLVVKPSGSPSGTVTDEDITAAEEGHEFAFELSQEPIRYIRLKILSTWGWFCLLLIRQRWICMGKWLNSIN